MTKPISPKRGGPDSEPVAGATTIEPSASPETSFLDETEYQRCTQTLIRAGIISILPEAGSMGVIGIDGQEYPVPTLEQAKDLFDRNRELIAKKREQGFTRLHLTPLAMPLTNLLDSARSVILRHYREEKIFQAKRSPSDPDIPINVCPEGPMRVAHLEEEGDHLLYFPSWEGSYPNYRKVGFGKSQLIRKPDICPIPGWSVGLIEGFSILPQKGTFTKIGGRYQLETGHDLAYYSDLDYPSPFDHSGPKGDQYTGETAWTPEDFLVDFVSRLEEINQVSHDYDDNSGLVLLGANGHYEGAPHLYAYWRRDVGVLQMGIGSNSFPHPCLGSRTMVRLA